MARSKNVITSFLPSKTLEFIGTSFTSTTIGQALRKEGISIDVDFATQSIDDRNNFVTMADLQNDFYNDRLVLAYRYGGKILKYFVDVIHGDLKSWVELDRLNTGGRPADIYRQYMIQRLAARAGWIIGEEATTTAKGKFENLCVAVLDPCGFRSTGIEKAIAAVLGKMNG